MPIQIVRNDITKMECDAIVNAANRTLLGGGGVDGAIHRAAGPALLAECAKLGGCATGDAKITGAYDLPCKYVIHTVGPIWQGGAHGERELLVSCYEKSLQLAQQKGCGSVAFPLISAGAYGYPKAEALRVAMDAISAFLTEHDMLVYIVIFDKAAFTIGEKLFADIQAFIDDRYAQLHEEPRSLRMARMAEDAMADMCAAPHTNAAPLLRASISERPSSPKLEELIGQIDESFTQMLLRKIDEKGMTDAACYKKANIDRKLFSKIRSDMHYKPSKPTAIAFAIALELPLEEARDMLMKAGYALSRSNKFDIIIEYFITNKNYNIYQINEALFAFDQPLLGM